MHQICQKAQAQNCRIWVDSEQDAVQTSIDSWAIPFMRKYNTNGSALVYNTLQAYLKHSRSKLTTQLALAQREGWTAGDQARPRRLHRLRSSLAHPRHERRHR